jgi:hypothetical protein
MCEEGEEREGEGGCVGYEGERQREIKKIRTGRGRDWVQRGKNEKKRKDKVTRGEL